MYALAALLVERIREASRRHLTIASLIGVAFAVAAFALAYLLSAAQLWLEREYQSDIEADATIGSALLVVALVAAGLAWARHRSRPPARSAAPVAIALAGPAAAAFAPKLLSAKWLGVAAVVFGGLLVGRELRRR